MNDPGIGGEIVVNWMDVIGRQYIHHVLEENGHKLRKYNLLILNVLKKGSI